MATRVAAAGGGNWTAGATWVGGVAPTAADDAQLTGTSGNVTIDSGAVARSLDATGYTGTLTHTAAVDLTLGDATAGAGNVALKLVAGMTYTLGNAATSRILFQSTSATQQTITTAGKVLGNFNINGLGSSYILGDANTIGVGATLNINSGTFNTGNFACSWGQVTLTGATAKTLTLGSSAITITGLSVGYSGSGTTFTANTAVMTFNSSTSATFNGNGANWNGLSLVFTNTTDAVITGVNTLANITRTGPANKTALMTLAGNQTVTSTYTVNGNSTINRILLRSSVVGTPRTVTAAVVSLSNTDFQDITAAGASSPWSGTSMGNALGNTNITFDAPVTQTRSGAGGNWSAAGNWTSRVPLPQDNVIIGAAASGTVTADMPRLGADIDFTGFTGTASFASVPNTMYGSIVLGSGMNLTGSQVLSLVARSSKTITSNGRSFSQTITPGGPGGTYTLQDNLSSGGPTLGLSNAAQGTFNANGFNVNVGFVSFGGSGIANMGSGTWTLTGISGNVFGWFSGTVNGSAATIVVSAASASTRTFIGGGFSYGTLTYNVAGSTGSLTITGSNAFGTINFSDVTNARTLLFTAGTTTTVTGLFNVFGTAGKLMTIGSDIAANHNLVKTGGVVNTVDYVSVSRSQASPAATWYAGANSVDGGNNTGWIFTVAPSTLGNFFFLF